MRVIVLALLILTSLASSSRAATLTLSIQNGLVSLDAQNVTVRQILTEWARVGKTRIVNVERLAGEPVTLKFERVPEKQALDIILRAVPGYMAAPRETFLADASIYDRILVMATTTAVAPLAAQTHARNVLGFPGLQGGANFTQMRQRAATSVDGARTGDDPTSIRWTIRPSLPRLLQVSSRCRVCRRQGFMPNPMPMMVPPAAPGAQGVAGVPAAPGAQGVAGVPAAPSATPPAAPPSPWNTAPGPSQPIFTPPPPPAPAPDATAAADAAAATTGRAVTPRASRYNSQYPPSLRLADASSGNRQSTDDVSAQQCQRLIDTGLRTSVA